MKRTIRTRQTLHVSRAFRPPPIAPPTLSEVFDALNYPPNERTGDQNHKIFRFLMTNPAIVKFLETPDRVEQAASESQLIELEKGEVLYFEGDEPNGWYLILDGTLDVIIRVFLIAEDCYFNTDDSEATKFAPLMDQMGLDIAIDKLRKVKTLIPDLIFGQMDYVLDQRRSSTIIGSSDTTQIIYFPPSFSHTSTLIHARNVFLENTQFMKTAFSRLRDDQIKHVASTARVIELKSGTSISAEHPIGTNLYIVKSGTLARYQVIDFTNLSFRVIDAPFEDLQLHFPDGLHAVHTEDLSDGKLVADPSITEWTECPFKLKATTEVSLIEVDLEFFKIVVGEFEVERIRNELMVSLSETDVVNIWVKAEKEKLWNKFKDRTKEKAHREIKTDKQIKASTYAIRVPKVPHALKPFKPKKVVPKAPKHLR